MRRVTIGSLAVLAVAGCAPSPHDKSQAMVSAVQDAEARSQIEAECVSSTTIGIAQAYGAIMNLPPDQAAREACRRLIAAVASGELTADQLAEMAGEPSPETRKAVLALLTRPAE